MFTNTDEPYIYKYKLINLPLFAALYVSGMQPWFDSLPQSPSFVSDVTISLQTPTENRLFLGKCLSAAIGGSSSIASNQIREGIWAPGLGGFWA